MEVNDPIPSSSTQQTSKRIAQLAHEILSVCKQLDEKSEKLKEIQDQNASLKDRLNTLEQEKLDTSRFTESLVKSRDTLIQEKTTLHNDHLVLEKRKDELELQVSKLSNDKQQHLAEIDELRQKCDQLSNERVQLQIQLDDIQNEKDLISYDKEQWKHEKEILLTSKQRYMNEIADRDQIINELRTQSAKEKAKIVDEMRAQNETKLEQMRTEATNAQQRLTEMLKKAAEAHRKLEDERNQLFEKHKLLEDNLDAYKRRFVAELQRSIDTRCSQMGNGLRNAFVDVVGLMDGDENRSTASKRSENDKVAGQWKKGAVPTLRSPISDVANAAECDGGGCADDSSSSTRQGVNDSDLIDPFDSVLQPCENTRRAKNGTRQQLNRSNSRRRTSPYQRQHQMERPSSSAAGAVVAVTVPNALSSSKNAPTNSTIAKSNNKRPMFRLVTTTKTPTRVAPKQQQKQRQQPQLEQQQHREQSSKFPAFRL